LIDTNGLDYPRNLDYEAFWRAADAASAVLMADLAHTAAIVSAGVVPSPFADCGVVVASAQLTTRSNLIFWRKGKINAAIKKVLCEKAGIAQTAAVAVAMKEAATPNSSSSNIRS
jgi:glycine hydroxymethyltransferase